MDPTFGHPLWIFVGAVLVLVGLWLFLWATGPECQRHGAR